MKLIKDTTDFEISEQSVITLGKFDGLHNGHRKLIAKVHDIARRESLTSVLFTFDIPPKAKLSNVFAKVILTNQEKRQLVMEAGIDIMIECPFLPEIMNMKPVDFIEKILVLQLHAKQLVIGDDFHFGVNRSGTPKLLKSVEDKYGYQTHIVDKVMLGGIEISSTRIRRNIEYGEMEAVCELLGYPYFITGEIVHGRQLGRTLGVPTINQIPPAEKLLPKRGVYTSIVTIEGRRYHGMTNIGIKPTVMGNFEGAETYLFDFSGNLYGKEARVELIHFQRPEIKFDSIEKLRQQLAKDERKARKIHSEKSKEIVPE